MIRTGTVLQSNSGRYLQSLKERLSGPVLADMLCTLQLHVELSIKAKAILLLQEQGFPVPADPEVQEKFRELEACAGASAASAGGCWRRCCIPAPASSGSCTCCKGRSG